MTDAHLLITENIDVWTTAIKKRSATGRGNNKKIELTGIKKLRELILELAVRGQLVPQDPNDEPASVLLEKIAAEKSQLIKDKKIKKPKVLPEIGEDEKLFELPDGWKWTRLQEISSYIQRGKGPKYEDFGQVRVVSQKCIQWTGFNINPAKYINDASLETYQEERYLQSRDLLWNSTGTGTVGRINILENIEDKTLVADSHVTVIRTLLVNSLFIRSYIAAPGIQQRIEPDNENALVSGSTKQVELNTSVVMSLETPIPPLSEQHRIVAKVDELMAHCDQLEQQTEDSITAHKTLVETLLATLTNSENTEAFNQNWTRIAEHFDTLFTTEHSIDQLKQTVLQLAVMGKLVPQNSNDEPAAVLLEKIAAEKEQLIKDKKIKKQKPLPAITEDEKPFKLPRGWEFCNLQDITLLITDGKHGDCGNLDNSGFYFLSAKNIQEGKLIYDNARQIIPAEFKEVHQRTNLEAGDICMVNTGATVGKMAIVEDNKFTRKTTFQKSVAVIKVAKPNINNEFLALFLTSETSSFLRKSGGSAINNLLLGDLKKKTTPLPPLAEQHRIAKKVNELITLCDQLKSQLNNAQATQLNLADTIVERTVN